MTELREKLRAGIADAIEREGPTYSGVDRATDAILNILKEHGEEAVEGVARALYEVSAEPEHGDAWERAGKDWQNNFRLHARAAISAFLSEGRE